MAVASQICERCGFHGAPAVNRYRPGVIIMSPGRCALPASAAGSAASFGDCLSPSSGQHVSSSVGLRWPPGCVTVWGRTLVPAVRRNGALRVMPCAGLYYPQAVKQQNGQVKICVLFCISDSSSLLDGVYRD